MVRQNEFITFIQSKDINCPGDGKCSNQGKCDGKRGRCTCNEGFNGDNCESKFHPRFTVHILADTWSIFNL